MFYKSYHIYIMASISGVLYIGVTSGLERRVFEHKSGLIKGFTSKYKCHKLVYCEEYSDVYQAITREKELKGWRREKKDALIKETNPHLHDLAQKS